MELTRQLLAVSAVLALLVGGIWWLRRKGFASMIAGGGRASRRLELVERLALTPHHSLHLVRVADQEILVAQSPSGVTLLCAKDGCCGVGLRPEGAA